MVPLHKFQIELFTAMGTSMTLCFPNGQFDVFGESPKVEIVLVARQYVWDDASLSLDVGVAHQCGNLLTQSGSVEGFLPEPVVEFSPVEPLHNAFKLLHVKVCNGPVENGLKV